MMRHTMSNTSPEHLAAELAAAHQEIERLRGVLAEAYQFAGTVGAPVRVLDNLDAASRGRELPHDSFLPISAEECDPLPGKEL